MQPPGWVSTAAPASGTHEEVRKRRVVLLGLGFIERHGVLFSQGDVPTVPRDAHNHRVAIVRNPDSLFAEPLFDFARGRGISLDRGQPIGPAGPLQCEFLYHAAVEVQLLVSRPRPGIGRFF